jgi:hypothetical protein
VTVLPVVLATSVFVTYVHGSLCAVVVGDAIVVGTTALVDVDAAVVVVLVVAFVELPHPAANPADNASASATKSLSGRVMTSTVRRRGYGRGVPRARARYRQATR